jgi:hypothetical protein
MKDTVAPVVAAEAEPATSAEETKASSSFIVRTEERGEEEG